MDPAGSNADPTPAADTLPDAAADSETRPGLPPPTAVESLVNALLEAGPEVADHVVRAAQELLLAAQAVVDAAGKAIDEQKDVGSPAAATPPDTTNVHPIDRNE